MIKLTILKWILCTSSCIFAFVPEVNCLSSAVKSTSTQLFRHIERSRIQAEETERASERSSQDQTASNEEKSATAAGDVSGHCFE